MTLRRCKVEVQHRQLSRFIALLRREKGGSLSWPCIDSMSNSIAVGLGLVRHALALGQVLADEAGGILILASFPRAMWHCEVGTHVGLLLDFPKLIELVSVLGSDRAHGPRLSNDQFDNAPV